MQLTVKTLKGGKFTIEVEPSNTVAEAKAVIVSRPYLVFLNVDFICTAVQSEAILMK